MSAPECRARRGVSAALRASFEQNTIDGDDVELSAGLVLGIYANVPSRLAYESHERKFQLREYANGSHEAALSHLGGVRGKMEHPGENGPRL